MRFLKLSVAIAAIWALMTACSGSKGSSNKIPILAWYSIPAEYASEETYRDLADAGFTINFSHLTDLKDAMKALDLGQKTGVKIMFTCTQLGSDPEGDMGETDTVGGRHSSDLPEPIPQLRPGQHPRLHLS